MRYRKPLTIPLLFSSLLVFAVSLFSTALVAQVRVAILTTTSDTCAATGDVNNDGTPLTEVDAVALDYFVWNIDNPPDNLWDCDMNGDGYIDQYDVQLYYDYLEYGLSVFDSYGGYPVLNDCNPSILRGSCCITDSVLVLSQENCVAAGGKYFGDNVICYQDHVIDVGDLNLDGMCNTIVDLYKLKNFVLSGEPEVDELFAPLWCYDINADGYIDWLDVQLMNSYIEGTGGILELNYICCPSTVRGACCLDDSCWVLSPENAAVAGGSYMGNGTTCESDTCLPCCLDITGNVNCSQDETPDIADVTRLIDYLYITHSPLCCRGEADVNASGDSHPDITDITRLIDFLYITHTALPDCPE